MLHPKTEMKFVSEDIGYGIFATELIPCGTLTWVKDELDRIITAENAQKVSRPIYHSLMKYTYRDRNGDYVFCWDLTRYINHSHRPNCILTSLGFEIAVRDIQQGEELTNDYGTLNIEEPFQCAYGPEDERIWVTPDDLITYHKKWDSEILQAIGKFKDRNQPLVSYLSPSVEIRLNRILKGEESMPSILENHFRSPK